MVWAWTTEFRAAWRIQEVLKRGRLRRQSMPPPLGAHGQPVCSCPWPQSGPPGPSATQKSLGWDSPSPCWLLPLSMQEPSQWVGLPEAPPPLIPASQRVPTPGDEQGRDPGSGQVQPGLVPSRGAPEEGGSPGGGCSSEGRGPESVAPAFLYVFRRAGFGGIVSR